MSTVFGATYAAHYDDAYRGKDYDRECDLLEEVFRRDSVAPVRTVLDLGCGTGAHALRLASRGYEVTGVDVSGSMLDVARRKSKELAPARPPRFVAADLRSYREGLRFDAVLMMFAVLGYQSEDEQLRAAIGTVRSNLEPGGLFIFDAWYGPAVEASGPSSRSTTLSRGDGEELRRVVSGELDRGRRTCRVSIRLERERAGRVRELTREVHVVRYFDREELVSLLAAGGLELSALTAFPSLDRQPDLSTWNVLGVARALPAG